MKSIVLAALIFAITPLYAVPPTGTALRKAPDDLPGPWIPGRSIIRDYKTLSHQLKEKLKADLQTAAMNPIDIAKKYRLSEKALRSLRKKDAPRTHRTYLRPKQTKKLVQRYGRNKHWLQNRTEQEGAFDLSLSKNQFQYIKKLYKDQQQKAAQAPLKAQAKKAPQTAKPQAKAVHTVAYMPPGEPLPKDLEHVPWQQFLPFYSADAHIPLSPDLRRPARAQPQRGVKRPHDAGAHTQHMQPQQPKPPKRRRVDP